jgi:hypothetical protein
VHIAERELMVRYLLGDLPARERDTLEEGYFFDNDRWDQLLAIENELIDTYVCGGLSPAERERFETHFMASPAKRQRVEFACLLLNARNETSEQRIQSRGGGLAIPPIARKFDFRTLTLLGAVACVALLCTLLTLKNRQLRRDISTLQKQTSSLPHQRATKSDPTAEAPLAARRSVYLLLTPGLLRGGGSSDSRVLAIPSRVSEIVLLLQLQADDFGAYDVVVKTAEGNKILSSSGLRSEPLEGGGRAVAVHLSSEQLDRGDYVATLARTDTEGRAERLESYTFSIR